MNENESNNKEEIPAQDNSECQDVPSPPIGSDVELSDYNPTQMEFDHLYSNATPEEKVAARNFTGKWYPYALHKMAELRTTKSPSALHAPVFDCYELGNQSYVGELVGFVGYISQLWDQKNISIEPNQPGVAITELTLSDGNTEIDCCPVLLYSFDQIVPENVGKKYFFWGTVLPQYYSMKKVSYNTFYIYGMTENIPLMKSLKATVSEKESTRNLFQELKTKNIPIRDFIKKRVVKHFNILNLDKVPDLEKAIDFTILQAFSFGSSSNYVNKIHSLIVGKPGRGKKLLTMIAKAINPISYEVSTDPKKVTSAGLIGRVSRSSVSISSKPGILPKTDGGIVCFQDAHYLPKDINPILSKVMEDGTIEDSTVAMVTHQARVSIHFDLNRKSDLQNFSGKLPSLESDFGLPRNIISRFDGIFHISSTNLEFAENVINQISETSFVGNVDSKQDDLRDIKLLVAYVLDGHRWFQKSLMDNITTYIAEKLEEFIDANKSTLTEEGSDILFSRLKNSILKMMLSLSYMRNRSFDEAMGDECMSIIADKFNCLSPYFGIKTSSLTSNSTQIKQTEIEDIISKKNSGTFSATTIKLELENRGIFVSDKTINRYLGKMKEEGKIRKVAHNAWEVV